MVGGCELPPKMATHPSVTVPIRATAMTLPDSHCKQQLDGAGGRSHREGCPLTQGPPVPSSEAQAQPQPSGAFPRGLMTASSRGARVLGEL